MRKPTVAVIAGVALWALAAGPAFGTARVSTSANGAATIAVDAIAGSDGDHGLIVEPFRDLTRPNAFRVRQDALGVPPIVSDQSECFTNAVFNDVVCGFSLTSIGVTTGDGADRVELSERGAGGGACPGSSVNLPTVRAEVSLGGGDDTLTMRPFLVDACSDIDIAIPVQAFGLGGQDTLNGGRLDDQLRGGDGRDVLLGGEGNDVLQGGRDGDTIDGGNGGDDVVQYDERTNPVSVTTFDLEANDGESGEGDNVDPSVERVSGSQAGDTLTHGEKEILQQFTTILIRTAITFVGNGGDDRLTGAALDDTLLGNDGADRLSGDGAAPNPADGGNDLLSGLAGIDTLVGGPGSDRLDGGAASDTIDARDGEIDASIVCGEGARDQATLDLRDPNPQGCELVTRFAVDDGPPGRAAAQRLRRGRDGRLAVLIDCPRAARTSCRGVLTLRAARGGRVLARGRYRVAQGRRGTVRLAARGLPRQVIAATSERGVSRRGPRSSQRLLRVTGRPLQ